MKFIVSVLLAVVAVLVCSVQAAPAPAPQFAAYAGSPLAYSGYSAYSPYYAGGLAYSPYTALGYSNLGESGFAKFLKLSVLITISIPTGYTVGGLSPYTYY